MPDSIVDGKKIAIATIVNFACCLIKSPKIQLIARVIASNAISDKKYHIKLDGSSALKIKGERAKTIRQHISVCINDEINCDITPNQIGAPFAL